MYSKPDIYVTKTEQFTPQQERILAIIAGLKRKIPMVIGGGASLALQDIVVNDEDGEPMKVADIDVITSQEGAYALNRILRPLELKQVEFGVKDPFNSHFGVFSNDGAVLEVMGDLAVRVSGSDADGTWHSYEHRLENPKMVNYKGLIVPVSSLDDQFISYLRLDRPKDRRKIEAIAEHLAKGNGTELSPMTYTFGRN